MKINWDLVIDKKRELITFPGYIPFLIDQIIPPMERYDFLKKIGIYHEVSKELLRCRKYTNEQHLLEVKKWVNQNPQFKEFIIEK